MDGFVTGTYRRVYRQAGPLSLAGVPLARKTLYHRNDFTAQSVRMIEIAVTKSDNPLPDGVGSPV